MSTTPFLTWQQYQALPPEKRQRPLTPAEYAALTEAQQEQLGLAEPHDGAPTDFGGPVFPNPDHIQPQNDTDPSVPVTRLPIGVSFQQQNTDGKLPADTSNPAPTQVLPASMSTTGAQFDPNANYEKVQFDPNAQYQAASAETTTAAKTPPADAPGMLDKEIPLDSYTHATESGFQSVARGLRDAAKGTWNQITAPPQDNTEKGIMLFSPAVLPLYRTLRSLGHTASDAKQIALAVHDINQSPDPTGTYLNVAQETAGQGAGQALLAVGMEGAAKAAPKVIDTVTSPTKLTAPVRAVVKGVNLALDKAPATVGTAIGAGAGAATGLPYATEVGAGLGSVVGKELLPKLRIPGEGFGLPNRVTGGPVTGDSITRGPATVPLDAAAADSTIPPAVETPTTATAAAATPQPPVSLNSLPPQAVQQAVKELGTGATIPDLTTRAQQIANGSTIPRTLSGESALRQVLTGQDADNLLKIARSRGINVTQEASLKPGVATPRLVTKILNDFSPDELDNAGATYLENTRMGKHNFGDIGPEAQKTLSLKTYFPDVKISAAQLNRTQAAIEAAKKVPQTPAPLAPVIPEADEDLTDILQRSVDQIRKNRLAQLTNTR